ncbi:hypothetical protein HHI36_016517 [Cryptolaemus montrouzieri]|uniref:Uncharacterized protein n=1 Tax=Cryptolaemus montrouzieri TaxID=559131 RepID=A0ABD2NJQ5_9CUCU
MGFNNRELMDELTKEPIKPNPRKRIISSFENLQDIRKQYSPKSKSEILNNSDFNLSQNISDFSLDQNFEEFKLEDCEIEEYASDILDTEKIEQVTEKRNISEVENVSETMEKTRSDEVIIPNLKKQCVELFKQQLEKQKGGTEHLMIDNKNNKRSNEPSYEHFLECTGLSSKSILTPSRIPTTHKTVLKPKDIKVRSKSKSNNYFDNTHSKSIKYWSEPFI